MNKSIATGCTAALLLTSGVAAAGAESGLYLGGSLGTTSVDVDTGTVEFDDDDSGYKIFAGYNFGLIPLLDLAIEGSYVDFGEVSSAEIGNADVGITGWDAFGVAGFKLGPIGVFGKVGMIAWESESDAVQDELDDSGSDPAYGIGASFQLGSLAFRAEYELFDTGDADVDYFSVGAAWTF
jgi:hypothetical protein